MLAVHSEITRHPDADPAPYDLAQVTALLPLPRRAGEILDFTGKWSRERSPQRRPLAHGTHARDVRRGKPGLDSPYLVAVGVPGFGFREGEVWGVHVAWSGDQRYLVEQLPEGAGVHAAVLGGGELLRAGEVRLAPGDTHRTPVCHYAWSGAGLDGLAGRFHTLLRDRPGHPRRPRPVILNSWEAVYFDHDPERLLRLADRAAEVGVERFVLDDGWFRGRRSDRAGLGDWTVDREVWPDGLTPLADHVRSLGMEFGLWVEPEMVNLGSDLARRHPEWVLAPARGAGPAARQQHVLDLSHPGVVDHLLGALDALVTEYGIAYLKWDHNREVHEAVNGPADRPAARAQVEALYGLLDTLRQRHPALEIESCASGGGRVDLGILARTDRVWASDCNDPVERQSIQRWTGQLLPPNSSAPTWAPRPATPPHASAPTPSGWSPRSSATPASSRTSPAARRRRWPGSPRGPPCTGNCARCCTADAPSAPTSRATRRCCTASSPTTARPRSTAGPAWRPPPRASRAGYRCPASTPPAATAYASARTSACRPSTTGAARPGSPRRSTTASPSPAHSSPPRACRCRSSTPNRPC